MADQERGAGGVANCRECGESLEPGDTWFHDVCTAADTTIERLQQQVAELTRERDTFESLHRQRVALSTLATVERDHLRARCAQLETAARLSWQRLAGHQVVRADAQLQDAERAINDVCERLAAALDQHATTNPAPQHPQQG